MPLVSLSHLPHPYESTNQPSHDSTREGTRIYFQEHSSITKPHSSLPPSSVLTCYCLRQETFRPGHQSLLLHQETLPLIHYRQLRARLPQDSRSIRMLHVVSSQIQAPFSDRSFRDLSTLLALLSHESPVLGHLRRETTRKHKWHQLSDQVPLLSERHTYVELALRL